MGRKRNLHKDSRGHLRACQWDMPCRLDMPLKRVQKRWRRARFFPQGLPNAIDVRENKDQQQYLQFVNAIYRLC